MFPEAQSELLTSHWPELGHMSTQKPITGEGNRVTEIGWDYSIFIPKMGIKVPFAELMTLTEKSRCPTKSSLPEWKRGERRRWRWHRQMCLLLRRHISLWFSKAHYQISHQPCTHFFCPPTLTSLNCFLITCNIFTDSVHFYPLAYAFGGHPAQLGPLKVIVTAVAFPDSTCGILLISHPLYLPGTWEHSQFWNNAIDAFLKIIIRCKIAQ